MPSLLSNLQELGVFWNSFVISFPMGTESLSLSPKMTKKIGIEVAYSAFKDSFRSDINFGLQSSLNPMISAQHGQNCKISVPIGKPMTRGF